MISCSISSNFVRLLSVVMLDKNDCLHQIPRSDLVMHGILAALPPPPARRQLSQHRQLCHLVNFLRVEGTCGQTFAKSRTELTELTKFTKLTKVDEVD